MLHDFDKTLEKLLISEGKLDSNEIDVSFEQPTSDWSSRLSRPTLNCWCFDLRENIKLRQPDRGYGGQPNGNAIRIVSPPRRVDVSYLVTAWARKVEDEHLLLWRALATLKRVTSIEPSQCEGSLRYSEFSIPVTVADMSANPVNLVDLWSVMDNQMRLGFIMTATLDLDLQLSLDVPLVLEATIKVGDATHLPTEEITHLSSEIKIRPKEGQTPEDKYKGLPRRKPNKE